MRRVLAFYEWLGEIECKRPERVFVRIKGAKDIMVGDAVDGFGQNGSEVIAHYRRVEIG